MEDGDGHGRSVTLRDLWKVLSDQTKMLSDHDRILARISVELDGNAESRRQLQAVQERVVSRLEQATLDAMGIKGALETVEATMADNRARIALTEEWKVKHEAWAMSKERDLRDLQIRVREHVSRLEQHRKELDEHTARMTQHENRAHVPLDDIPALTAMAAWWRDAKNAPVELVAWWLQIKGDRQQFIAKFKENAVSAPIAIVTGAVTTTILIWLQHAFHFIK